LPLATPRRPGAAAPRPRLPSAEPPRQRAWVLDIPWEMRSLAQAKGVPWDPAAKAHVWRGVAIPDGLEAYASQPWSWERWQEDELNGAAPRPPSAPEREVSLREHQKAAAKAVLAAKKAGRSGFLIADDVGLGKTIETWVSVLAMRDVETVLVVCPLAVVAHWRRTIAWLGDGGKRIVVINYDRLKKLFEVPKAMAEKARGRRKGRRVRTQKGVARYGEAAEFDLVVFDESHRLRNVETARYALASRLADPAEFVLWLSATAGQDPLELAYLAPILAEATGARAAQMKDFAAWCKDQGVGVSRGAYGKWEWRGRAKDARAREGADEDLEKIRRMLFEGAVPVGIRRSPTDIAGWPEINRIMMPVELAPADRAAYGLAWAEFRAQLGLERRGRGSSNGLVARLRFRQKASLLRTAATVDLARDLLDQGQQVAVSVAFKETMAIIRDALAADGYRVAEIHGDLPPAEKEAQRLDFQHGRATVVVYTVEEGISLHEGEYNDAKRSNIIHDLRWSGIQMKQVEGRTHRDGKFSQVYWMLGAGTVEEEIARIVAGRMVSMGRMQGDAATVEAIEELFARVSAD
jgi:hypothetical protein